MKYGQFAVGAALIALGGVDFLATTVPGVALVVSSFD